MTINMCTHAKQPLKKTKNKTKTKTMDYLKTPLMILGSRRSEESSLTSPSSLSSSLPVQTDRHVGKGLVATVRAV